MTHDANSPDDRADTRFGVYELRRLLGQGRTSEVYEAYDTSKDRVVALKLLRGEAAEDPAATQRFLAHARSRAGLSDPHIIPVHESGTVDGTPFIDMRLVEGHTLSAELAAHGRIKPARAVHIVSQLADALDASRAGGLVHRTIAPKDVIVTRTDFAYLAADEITDSDSISDVATLAAILHETLTGTIFSEGISPSAIVRSLPRHFDTVIAKGLSADSARHYSSARELARDAALALSMPDAPEQLVPISPRPMPRPASPIRTVEPNEPLGVATPPPPLFVPETRRTLPIILGVAAVAVVLLAGSTTAWFLTRPSQHTPTAVAAASTPPAPTTPPTPATTRATTPITTASTAPARTGDLGLSTPMTIPDCDGTGIVVLANATQPGSYAAEIQSYLDAFPGARYLRTDQSCSSLRQVSDSGTAIYAVYFPSGTTQAEICTDVRTAGGNAYGKWLDTATNPSSLIAC